MRFHVLLAPRLERLDQAPNAGGAVFWIHYLILRNKHLPSRRGALSTPATHAVREPTRWPHGNAAAQGLIKFPWHKDGPSHLAFPTAAFLWSC